MEKQRPKTDEYTGVDEGLLDGEERREHKRNRGEELLMLMGSTD